MWMHEVCERANHRLSKRTTRPLIGEGSVREPIAKNPSAGSKRRLDALGKMLGAGSEHEQEFSLGGEGLRPRLEQERANFLGKRRSPRFPSDLHVDTARFEFAYDRRKVGALACALSPFHGDEAALLSHGVRPAAARRAGSI